MIRQKEKDRCLVAMKTWKLSEEKGGDDDLGFGEKRGERTR